MTQNKPVTQDKRVIYTVLCPRDNIPYKIPFVMLELEGNWMPLRYNACEQATACDECNLCFMSTIELLTRNELSDERKILYPNTRG